MSLLMIIEMESGSDYSAVVNSQLRTGQPSCTVEWFSVLSSVEGSEFWDRMREGRLGFVALLALP